MVVVLLPINFIIIVVVVVIFFVLIFNYGQIYFILYLYDIQRTQFTGYKMDLSKYFSAVIGLATFELDFIDAVVGHTQTAEKADK